MNIDFNSIVTLASVSTTIAVTVINAVHNTKIKKLELENSRLLKEIESQQEIKTKIIDMYYIDKKTAFQNLSQALGDHYILCNGKSFSQVQSSAQTSLLFCDFDESKKAITNMIENAKNLYLKNGNTSVLRDEFYNSFESLTKALNKELQSIKHTDNFDNIGNRV